MSSEKKCLDSKLLQKEVAQKLSVCGPSFYKLENNLLAPSIEHIPKIIGFFGYVSFDTAVMSVGEKILACCQIYGLIQRKLVLRSERTIA